MVNKREKIQYAYVLIVDIISIVTSVTLVWFWFDSVLGLIQPYEAKNWVQTIVLLGISFATTFLWFNQSDNITTRPFKQEIKTSIKFNIIIATLYSTLMLLTKAEMIDSRYFAIAVPLINAILMPLFHLLLKKYLMKYSKNSGMESLVGVVSIKENAGSLIKELSTDWSKRICGVALLDIDDSDVGSEFDGVKVYANFNGFMDWIRHEAIDEVYVDIPMYSGDSFLLYLDEMESMGLTVHFHLQILDHIEEVCCDETRSARLYREIGRCDGKNIITMGTTEVSLRDLIIKRIVDICGAIVGCIISIPIILIVAIPLKLESKGSLIFKQERIGLNGRRFYIHKLRSMYTDAEKRKKDLMGQNEMNGLMFKIKDDPRVTKVGRFIRKTSIDELPQFFDVLVGNMSLVGTRPPTIDEYKKYESHHKRRLSMKPGITGLWQISGRNDIENFEDVVKLDVKYIDNWSLWLDIKILLKTIAVVFNGRGAS